MERMRILHIADVHLGAEPDKGKPWGEGRGRMLWDSFADTLNQAREKQADLVLVAGDLFHRQPLKRELREVNELFGRLGDIPVIMMAGNHDYISKNSAYKDFEWHKNVHMFLREQPERIVLEKPRVVIYGLSYEHREIREPLYRSVKGMDRVPGAYHILLAHGGDEKHIPTGLLELQGLGMDYVALGHIHKPAQWKENRIVMAGSLRPLEYQDAGSRGYWLVDLVKDSASASFFPVRGCEYIHFVVELESRTTNLALLEEIRERMEQAEENQIFKIILSGSCDPDMDPDIDQIASMPRVAAVEVNVRPAYDFDKLRDEYTDQIIGRFIRRLKAEPQTEVVKQAMLYGVEALMGH